MHSSSAASSNIGLEPVELWSDVQGPARLVRRDVLGVEGDGRAAGSQEQVRGHRRQREHLGRVPKARGVAVRAEERDPAGIAGIAGNAEGLESF